MLKKHLIYMKYKQEHIQTHTYTHKHMFVRIHMYFEVNKMHK